MTNKQSQLSSKSTPEGIKGLQVVKGGRVKPRPSRQELDSAAERLLYHDCHLFPLALKAGVSQHELAWIAIGKARSEGYENGMKAERARVRFLPPVGRAA